MDTGLMYLCKTTTATKRDPYEYKGSGKYWLRHINKHKPYIITCVIGEYDTKEDLKEAGTILSEKYDIVKSTQWANLVPEQGDGGWIHDQTGNTWKVKDPSKMGKHTNQWMNDDGTRQLQSSLRMKKHNPSFNTPKTEKQIQSSKNASRIATEASKKSVGYIDTITKKKKVFESKRALINHLNISYDVLNYRLKTGILYNNLQFFENN